MLEELFTPQEILFLEQKHLWSELQAEWQKIRAQKQKTTQSKLLKKFVENFRQKVLQAPIKVQRVQTKEDWKQKFPYEKLNELKDFAKTIQINPAFLPAYPAGYWQNHNIQEYIQRVEHELKIIADKGYSSYFLVFGDIMRFCREQGIVTNTRGSAAGSMVGFLTNISVLDPILYILPFERFLNPLRPSPPDIDGDFADDRRQEVIDYIIRKYGKENVSQIATYGVMLPRMVVRDVGRVLGVSYKKCDQLSKTIPIAPQGKKTTFKWAFETSEELRQLYEKDPEVKRIIDISRRLEGNHRHASVHAAGVLIAPSKLTNYAPLQWDSDHKNVICQFDMRVCEKVGLVKMDILGITNLSFLGKSLEKVKKRKNIDIDLLSLNTEDKKTFELLAKGKTMGIFQLSGPAMTKYLVELRPNKVQDLMAMVALYRPGPMGIIPEYIKRKHNPQLIEYYVPQMKEWMEASLGLFVYQEDLLFTAIYLAGYDWGQVDVLRKGMGKKIQEVIDSQKPIFIQGCIEKSGISQEKAEELWNLMVPFGAYGFNKSHSSSYGMTAFWTAYMKANYPVEFMTSLMTSEAGDVDKIAAAIKECQDLGIQVLPPDINKSDKDFTIEDDQTIRYGLGSIKNLGEDIVELIIQIRKTEGEFQSLDHFLEKMSRYQQFSKKSLEALIYAGCLDSLAAQEFAALEKVKT